MATLIKENNKLQRQLWTDKDFLDWLEPSLHADLIHGEKFMHSPVNLKHADMTNFLDFLIRSHLQNHQIGGKLYREVVAVRLNSRCVFLPDLAYFTPEQEALLLETHAPIAPKWVCEVLSPRTADRDIGPKFTAYEEHGVEEYWILDPETYAHQFFRKQGEIFEEYSSDQDWVESWIIRGFKLKKSWISSATFPSFESCLNEIY